MPGGFAIAALGEALRFRVEQMILRHDSAQVGNVSVVARSPEELSSNPPNNRVTLSVFAYHFTVNPGWQSSRPLPYGAGGQRRENPLLALDARFVLTAYGPEPEYERALGIAMLALHETHRITREILEAAAANIIPPGSPLPAALGELAEQEAPIKCTPLAMNPEELSQVWSTLNAGVHPGMCYEVGTLLMEHVAPRDVAPPVAEPRLGVRLLNRPNITRMQFAPPPAAEADFHHRAVASPGDAFRLYGAGLRGEITEIKVGRRILPVDPVTARPDLLEGTLPSDLRPGLVTAQVRHSWDKPEGEEPPPASGTIPAELSNLMPLAIRPVLAATPVTLSNRRTDDGVTLFDATLHFDVDVGAQQDVELFLRATTPDADGHFTGYSFAASPETPPPALVSTRTCIIAGVEPGDYILRVQVDGAESELERDATGYSGPIVTVPS